MSVMHRNVAVVRRFDIHLDGPLAIPERLSDLFQGRHLEFGAFNVPIQRLEVHNESALAVLLWYQERVHKEAFVVWCFLDIPFLQQCLNLTIHLLLLTVWYFNLTFLHWTDQWRLAIELY